MLISVLIAYYLDGDWQEGLHGDGLVHVFYVHEDTPNTLDVHSLPLAESLRVLIIFAANSRHDVF